MHPSQLSSKAEADLGSTYIEDTNSPQMSSTREDVIENEPALHSRTFLALGAMVLLNYVTSFALFSPPAALSSIGADLNGTTEQIWIQQSLLIVQAVFCPVVSFAADTFDARKMLLVSTLVVGMVGAAIAPGSQSIGRLIAAQALVGVAFSSLPLGYSIPSEIVPRKYRPLAQAIMNMASALGGISGPLIIGALSKANVHTGWRTFFWIETGFWGAAALGIFLGYKPPKHSRIRTQEGRSLWQKILLLDPIGFFLLAAGLSLFIVGLNLGGGLYPWTSSRVLATLILGLVILLGFGLYEWKGTRTGLVHHDLFNGTNGSSRTFSICLGLILVESALVFAFIIFYPVLTAALFETDPFLIVAREQPWWIAAFASCLVWAAISIRWKRVREPLAAGFFIFTCGTIGLATIQPGQNINAMAFSAVNGVGFGAALILIVTAIQYAAPHHLIGTVTALTISTRALGASVTTAICGAAFGDSFGGKLPVYVGHAALSAGLPQSSLGAFIGALASNHFNDLLSIPGVTPEIVSAGTGALQHAYADSLRLVFIIVAPFGMFGTILCFFMPSFEATMNKHIDEPLEAIDISPPNPEEKTTKNQKFA